MTEATAGLRIDVWLWAARFFKTRSLCKQAVEAGKVQVNGQVCKASRQVHVDDRLHIARGEEKFEILVRELSDLRGPAPRAQTLYRETEESYTARHEAHALRKAANAGFQAPKSKPDKRARRLIQALGDIDAL